MQEGGERRGVGDRLLRSGVKRHPIAATAAGPIVALSLLLAPVVSAEEALETAPTVDETALFSEIPSVFAASKYEQKITEAPSAVSIVTGDEIRQFGYRSLSEVLAGQQGFFTTSDRLYDHLAVRGFGLAGDFNTRVLILIDGHRINDTIYGSGPTGNEFPLDIELIERLEVVRGPSSALYGSNAFLAVVNIVTRRGRDLEGTELRAGAGSLETYLARATHGKKLANGLEYLVSGTYQDTDGNDRLYFPEFDDPLTNDGIARDADHDEAYRLLANFDYRNWRLQTAHGSREKKVPTAPYETVFDTDRTRTEDTYTWVDLSYSDEWGDGWYVTGRAFYDRYVFRGEYLYDDGDPGNPDPFVNRDDATGQRWGSELRFNKLILDRHHLTAGLEIEHNFQQDQSNKDLAPNSLYLNSRESRFNFGLFAQDDIEILENLHLGLGLRYDHDGAFGSTVNPRGSIVYAPWETTIVKLLSGTAYRAPTAYEIYYEDSEGIQVGNTDLDPETIWTTELVLEQGLPSKVHLTASAYYSQIDDLIAQELTGSGALQFQNASSARA